MGEGALNSKLEVKMKNQWKYNEAPRKPNSEELSILQEVEIKYGMRINVLSVEYLREVPRATLCIACINTKPLYIGKNPQEWLDYLFGYIDECFGVTIRSKSDIESVKIGQLNSFRRALQNHVDYQRRLNRKIVISKQRT